MGVGLLIFSVLIIFLARYANVYLISYILNSIRSENKISYNYTYDIFYYCISSFMSWFSGFRGAMAYALALNSVRIF